MEHMEDVVAGYQEKLWKRANDRDKMCSSFVSDFLHNMQHVLTVDAFDRGNGVVRVPIPTGCFPQMEKAMMDRGMKSSNLVSFSEKMRCECAGFHVMDSSTQPYIIPSSLTREMCEK